MNIFQTVSRWFTIPRKVRTQIDHNPAVALAVPILLPALVSGAAGEIDKHVNDKAANAALKDALAIAIRQVLGPHGE